MQTKKQRQDLFKAFLHLKNINEVERFLTDLCTPGEIDDFCERWEIAKLLDEGQLSYREISATTGASTTTVARVSRFLNQEDYQGYRLVLNRAKNKNN